MNFLRLLAPLVVFSCFTACQEIPTASSNSYQIQTIATVDQTTAKASLELQGAFVKNQTITVQTDITSPMASTVRLDWLTAPYVELSQQQLVVSFKAGETKRIRFQAKLKRRGFFDITLHAESSDWSLEQAVGDRIGFDVVKIGRAHV